MRVSPIRFLRPAFIAVFLLACFTPAAFALWRPMPWGLVTIWWDLPSLGSFQSLSMEVDVVNDLPSDRHLYLAAIGAGKLDNTRFYGGLQVGAKVPGGGQDKIALFSRWGERSRDAIRVAPGGFSESSGHEGDFIGVRRAVPWHSGRYVVSLTVVERSADSFWAAMTVLESASGRTWDIGSLRFPGNTAALGPGIASFVEVYGEPISPEHIPHVTIKYGGMRINGVSIIPKGAKALYTPDIPPYAEARRLPGGWIAIDIGGEHDHSSLPRTKDGRPFKAFSW